MGDRLTVGQRTLTPPVLVRIQVPQPPDDPHVSAFPGETTWAVWEGIWEICSRFELSDRALGKRGVAMQVVRIVDRPPMRLQESGKGPFRAPNAARAPQPGMSLKFASFFGGAHSHPLVGSSARTDRTGDLYRSEKSAITEHGTKFAEASSQAAQLTRKL